MTFTAPSLSSKKLQRSLRLITLGGGLSMIYMTGIQSPVVTEFFRRVGATDFHFGLLRGIPLGMVFFQWVGAYAANRLRRRKPAFMVGFIVGRLLYLPVAFLPLLIPGLDRAVLITILLCLISVNRLLGHFSAPLWLSWMADLIPHRVLNTYWGVRRRSMYLFWTGSLLAITVYTRLTPWRIQVVFPVLACVAVAAGVVDILLFFWVHEPQNRTVPEMSVRQSLLAPLVHGEYRTFVVFACVRMATILFVAGFIQPYMLKVLGLPVWQATLIWCAAGVGNAASSKWWGRLADRHGHRPILKIIMFCKPWVPLVMLLGTHDSALVLFPLLFLIDGAWNAGMMVANNGYMMKIAPQENRAMFVAAITGLGGICGGIAATLGGAFLKSVGTFSVSLWGREWGNYHLLFFIGFFLRFLNCFLIRRVKEPQRSSTATALYDLLALGMWPWTLLRGQTWIPFRREKERRNLSDVERRRFVKRIAPLPDLLRREDGTEVTSKEEWSARRREILDLLLREEYGPFPPNVPEVRTDKIEEAVILEGLARERRFHLLLPNRGTPLRVEAGLILPEGRKGPFPTLLAVDWIWLDHLRPVAKRMTEEGIAFAGYKVQDLDRDDDDRSDGVHALFPGYDGGTLSVWAWGAMRMMDCLSGLEEVDEERVAVTGHSRAGKTALLAGAADERFALVAPHASGAGGAGSFLSLQEGSESLAAITDPERFHYWFHENLRAYAGEEERLPFDQHFLKALVAPRPLLCMEGLDDHWANPEGSRLTTEAAQSAFDLLGNPSANQFFIRGGGHDMVEEDWEALIRAVHSLG